MAITIEQHVALDEALVPSAQRFKMDTRKNIIDLEAFREMFHISPRVPGQSFAELPFEEDILEFLRFLRHSAEIKTLTDSQIISSANFMGAISPKKRDYAFLIWEDFVYQVEHKNQKKSNEMYYSRFIKVTIHYFITKKPSIPRRNKVNWHYVRDDILFSTIKVVSRHKNTQQYGVILPIELTTEDIRNTKAYKEYYACATGEAAPKPKASARKKKGGFASSTTPPTPIATPTPTTTDVAALRLSAAAKEAEQLKIVLRRSRQETHISQQKNDKSDDGQDDDDNDNDDEEEIAKIDEPKDTESGGDDEETKSDKESEEEETTKKEEESFDPIPRTPEESEDDGNGEEDQGLRISKEERMHEEEEADELYRDVNINQGMGLQVSQDIEDSHVALTLTHSDGQQESSSTSSFVTNLLNPIIDPGMESIFTTRSSFVTPIPSPKSTMTPSIITTTTSASQPPIPPTPIPSDVLQTLPTFASVFRFKDRVKSLEVNFSEFMRTNQSTEATDGLQDSLQRENDENLKTIDDNMKKIIKEQVKSQVKAQVSRILPRIEESVNVQLKAEVLTRSSHSSRTSYVVAVDLSEMELKKILIDKMEGNKSIQRSDEQRNLYKALVEAYDADKTILDTYGESAILKRRRDDDDDQEGPSAGSDRGSKRRREGGEHASTSTPSEPATWIAGRSLTGTQSRQMSASETAFAEEPVQTTCQMEEPSHSVFETGVEDQPIVQTSQHPEWFSQPRKPLTPDQLEYHLEEVYKATTDHLDWDNPVGQQYPHNLLQPFPLIPDNRVRRVILFEHFINNDLEYLRGGASSRKYTTSVTKTKVADYGHIKWIEDLVPRTVFAVNWESALDVYSKRRIIDVTDLKIVEWHNYKHLDWISVRRDDDKIYKFKEGDFKRLRLQDIEDMLLLLRHVEDLQLGVKSYQKWLNLTKPDTYRSDLKRREAYTAYSNPRGFIYQNRDKKNRLMRIDELRKFSDETLNDVRNAMDDRLKRIRMQYLPTTIWRKGDKDRAAAMIQAIDKMLKTRRIMRSLERIVTHWFTLIMLSALRCSDNENMLSLCARYQANPNEHHVSAVKMIFRYLKGTINLGLWYLKDFGFDLTAYSDADHAGCHLAEFEYVAVSSCCAQVLWMRTQLTDYGFFYDKVPIYCDSKSAIAISCNSVRHTRTKHIDVRTEIDLPWSLPSHLGKLGLDGGDNQTVEQVRKRAKWDNDDYVCRDFKHILKHKKGELTLVELVSHQCIEESLKVQDSDKPERNNIAGPLVFNMAEHNNSSRVWGCMKVVRLHDPKLKTLGERGIECIFVGYVEHSKAFRFNVIKPNESVLINSIIESKDDIFDENKFSLVPRLNLRISNRNKDIGGLVVFKKVIEEDVAFWKEAINDKMDSIMGNNTWVLADLPPGIDYFDIYPLVARISTIRLLISMTSIHNLITHQMDVKIAFLNGEPKEEVYMNQPQGFIMPGKENKVSKLIKSLYGLKHDMGEADVILGIRIKHESNGIAISQSRYIEMVLKKFNYFECTLVSTLMDARKKLMPNNSQVVSQLEYYRVIGCLMETIDYRLTYTGYPSVLEGYTDASWISNTKDNSSTSGWVFLLGDDAISWASKQTCITGSIKEYEFLALAAAGKEAGWLKNMLLEIPLARITEARFEDENNQAVDTNIGDPDVKDKQEVKKADDQEIKNIKYEEDKIVEDQQVSEADDDTNNDDFGCSLSPHKGVDLTVEEHTLEVVPYPSEQGRMRALALKEIMGVQCFRVVTKTGKNHHHLSPNPRSKVGCEE
nr:zinc finger, CCHC-type [Tanacetum cinerariifolium]